jgi:hypothetical protein
LGFQELMTSSSPDMLAGHDHDDHAHPFPSLRPLIQSAILRKTGHFDTAVAELDATWKEWVAANWPGLADPLAHQYTLSEGVTMSGAAILAHLSRPNGPLDKVLDVLAPINNGDCWTSNQSPARLYDSFSSGKFLLPEDETAVPPQRSDSRTIREKRMAGLIEGGSRDDRLVEIFKGWSTEGPESSNSGL